MPFGPGGIIINNITTPLQLGDVTAIFDNFTSSSSNDSVSGVSVPAQNPPNTQTFQYGANFQPQQDIDCATEQDNGIFICGVAGPVGTQPEILQVHQPYSVRTVKGTVEQVNAKPAIPSMVPPGNNEVCMRWKVTPAAPVPGPEGVHIHRVSYLYFFAQAASSPGIGSLPIAGASLSIDLEPATLHNVDPLQLNLTLLSPV